MKLVSEIDKTDFDKSIIQDIALKFIPTTLALRVWKVTFKYKTKRGNKKENHKYLLAHDDFETRCKFFQYIEKFNEDKPYRTLLNVKILSIDYIGTIEKLIE